MSLPDRHATKTCGYAPVNDLKMYYEIEGSGDPLVYIPPAFGFAGVSALPTLVKNHATITMDLQGHGRTADVADRPLSIEQHARDVVGLLQYLGIAKASFFGESYGGAVATTIALRNPELASRVATYGATFGPPEVAVDPEKVHFDEPPTAESKCFQFQRENYSKAAPEPEDWPRLWEKVLSIKWGGFSKEELASIQVPFLILLGDHDFVRLDHALDTFRLIPNAELAVIPDAGHFAMLSEPERIVPTIENFFNKPDARIPIATAAIGYRPGETR